MNVDNLDMGTVPSVAAALVALGALVVASLALGASRRSAAASERSAKTAERLAQLAMEVRWVVAARDDNGGFLLTNAGRETAYRVDVGGPVTLTTHEASCDISGGESVVFRNVATFGSKDFFMKVSWSPTADADERRTWRYPLT